MYYGVLLFLNLGTPEIILIVFVALLLFGGKKLPELARGLGKGIREFKDASDDVKREIHRNINTLTAEEELRRDEAAAQKSSVNQQPDEEVTSTETRETIKP
ncbi:Sec-independent protein translocase subunit TatA/TatB [Pedobacter glucosidilyticus]|uniref:Sec-independent protein translocase subunit TatA/TatB n=1 Tax=Pedobacter glucosidilyticus TaxID=1122941 RepID=UPI0003F6AC07|nr:twin-arginine translocase TatA/TatE family subunit [Pedobacter glucosidilyticus]